MVTARSPRRERTLEALSKRRRKERRFPKPPGRSGDRPFLEFRWSETAATAKYTNGATTTMLVILISNDSEIAMAATKNDEDSPCSTHRRNKYNPTIAKLSDGTSGMNERPAKRFSGVKQ
jgi:hypothetical protein